MPEATALAVLKPGEQEKIDAALEALAKDTHAPREIQVTFLLRQPHQEYPKHVTIGKDKEGNPITKVANSPAEEKAFTASGWGKPDKK